MKKTIALIGVAALLATVLMPSTVSAQSTPVAQTPATIATTVTTNLASGNVMDVRRQQNVYVMFSFNQASASTSNVVYTLQKSNDGSVYDTNNPITITIASQGATRVDYGTNLNIGGASYVRIFSIANTTALTTLTNFGATYSVKANAP